MLSKTCCLKDLLVGIAFETSPKFFTKAPRLISWFNFYEIVPNCSLGKYFGFAGKIAYMYGTSQKT